MSSSRTAGIVLAALGVTLGIGSWLLTGQGDVNKGAALDGEGIAAASEASAAVAFSEEPAPDAGEGAKAKDEEGRVGKTDARPTSSKKVDLARREQAVKEQSVLRMIGSTGSDLSLIHI